MKKPWLLFVAGTLLLTLIGLWLYLFFGGEEAREDLYNRFGFEGDELPFDIDDIFTGGDATSTPPYLRQLSLRQAAGYTALESSSTSPRTVLLAEKGTGHIYSINVDDGSEERRSNITVPGARTTVFSPDGMHAAIYDDTASTFTIITLPHGSSTLTSNTINAKPISVSFTTDGKLLYAQKERQSVRGYLYTVSNATSKPLFTVPFREAVVLWGNTESGPHYTYPRTAEELEGYLYEINGTSLKRLPISGFGLSVKAEDGKFLYTKNEDSTYKSYLRNSNTLTPLERAVIPEKCTFRGDVFLCTANEGGPILLSDWYRGEQASNDTLWYFIPGISYATSIENLSATAQRMFDATNITSTDTALYFTNTIDATLWVYDRDFASSVLDN